MHYYAISITLCLRHICQNDLPCQNNKKSLFNNFHIFETYLRFKFLFSQNFLFPSLKYTRKYTGINELLLSQIKYILVSFYCRKNRKSNLKLPCFPLESETDLYKKQKLYYSFRTWFFFNSYKISSRKTVELEYLFFMHRSCQLI